MKKSDFKQYKVYYGFYDNCKIVTAPSEDVAEQIVKKMLFSDTKINRVEEIKEN